MTLSDMPPIRAIVTDPPIDPGPLPLTPGRLHDALYCCAPVGESALASHLELRGYRSSRSDIEAAMSGLIAAGVSVGSIEQPFNGAMVRLLTIKGQSK